MHDFTDSFPFLPLFVVLPIAAFRFLIVFSRMTLKDKCIKRREILMKNGVFAAGIVTVATWVFSLHAQVPEDLPERKDFRALRIASTDPKFKNADFRRIEPEATWELGRIEGRGRITHMWFTINSKSPDHLRELVLRIYWDVATQPAVECP